MLESIKLINYERHANTLIEFVPGITAITGPSFIGKSAVMRGLLWVATNRPTGTGFIRHGAKSCEVAVATSNGIVRRRRSQTINQYVVNNERPLKAIGASVPDVVTNTLRLDLGLNIQRQFDSPYLLFLTPGEVARHFNDITGLSVIDNSFSDIRSREVALSSDKKQAENTLEAANTAMKKLSWVVRAEEGLEAVKQALTAFNGQTAKLTSLQRILSRREAQKEKLKKAQTITNRLEKNMGKVERALKEFQDIEIRLSTLKKIQDKREYWNHTIEASNKQRARLMEKEEELVAMLPSTCPFCGGSMKGGRTCVE